MNLSCLPYEIKLKIIDFIPLTKQIVDNPPPIFHDYIINYINTKLLKNMYISGILCTNDIYNDIISAKLENISLNITNKFMNAVQEIGGPVGMINENMPIISLKIIFKFTTVGNYYNSDTNDIKYSLSSYSIYNNYCTWVYNDTTFNMIYTKESIHNEIWRILIKNMNYSDTTIDIKSMEMVKTDLWDNYNDVLFKFI
jgi:hypothetical protein